MMMMLLESEFEMTSTKTMTTTKRSTNSTAFDLEPNPFEQSFSRTSSSSKNNQQDNINSQEKDNKLNANANANQLPIDSDTRDSDKLDKNVTDSPKPTLPPLAAIASPGGQSYSNWALSSSALANSNSLRSGPLSPAMLSGPTQPMDHTTFRTGLTPATGLTPLVSGGSAFPPPSPNTAAFLAMVAGGGSGALPTPNTIASLTGTGAANASNNNLSYSSTQNNAQTSAASVAAAAANGLFLLSQAHQELTKREEAQARAGLGKDGENIGIEPSAINRRGAKRKVEDPPPPPQLKSNPKKAKSNQNNRKKRGSTVSDDDDDGSVSPTASAPLLPSANNANHKSTKDMTDEEKRRNFLERNRQAALKCRQRKKAWLAQLQAKVEFLTAENERLTTALVSSREEITRLNALVGSHPPPGHLQVSHGHAASGTGAHGSGQQQPVSVVVSLPASGKGVLVNHGTNGNPQPTGVTAGGSGRGYGY